MHWLLASLWDCNTCSGVQANCYRPVGISRGEEGLGPLIQLSVSSACQDHVLHPLPHKLEISACENGLSDEVNGSAPLARH